MVYLVRSEDRRPSKRVFPLLQNLDLDTVTFAQVQSTGDPISIEDMNEQEMVDLIIVNLARLCVAGEWDGLLSAGGGEEMLGGTPNGDWQSGRLDYQSITCSHGRTSQAQTTLDVGTGRQMFWPFTAANTGDLTSIGIKISTAVAAQNVRVGIYNAADDGNPSDLIGYADFDAASTGELFVTSGSFSDTITLARGSVYWYAVVQTTTGAAVSLTAMNCTYSGATYLTDDTDPSFWSILNYTDVNTLSDPAAMTNMRGASGYAPPHCSVGWL